MADLMQRLSEDVLNADTYPRYAAVDFEFDKERIQFPIRGETAEYTFKEGKFTIQKGETAREYDVVKEFSIKYLDKNDFEVMEDDVPFYCEMKFIFFDNHETILKMRL